MRANADFLLDGSARPAARAARTPPEAPDPPEPDPVTPDASDSCWDACEWLAPLRDVPPNATWPRLMSPPHPAATGTFGWQAVRWIESNRGDLRWWQQLVIVRLLEHDAHGRLVWLDAVVSTARQVGKSVTLSGLALWRMHAAELFLEPQLVLHLGRDLAVCRQIHKVGRQYGRDHGYYVRETNGQEEVTEPGGSSWLVRSKGGAYGVAASLAMLDEAWDVPAAIVDDGLEPTLAERESGQLVLFSTAHRKTTPLVPMRRQTTFASWDRPTTTLWLEWSAPRDTAIDDPDGWRMASPYWTPSRQRLLTAKLERVTAGEVLDPDEHDATESFRSQYLNQWPTRQAMDVGKAQPLCDRDTWRQLTDLHVGPEPAEPVTVAVEDWYGLGASAAAATVLPDGRVLTWGSRFPTRAEAYAWAGYVIGEREHCRVVVGASMSQAEAKQLTGCEEVSAANTTTTRGALPVLRSLVVAGGLAHSGEDDLCEQVATTRLVASTTGGLVVAHAGVRHDLLKATAWAVADRADPVEQAPDWWIF